MPQLLFKGSADTNRPVILPPVGEKIIKKLKHKINTSQNAVPLANYAVDGPEWDPRGKRFHNSKWS